MKAILRRFRSIDALDVLAVVIFIAGIVGGYIGMKMRHP
jgi:hypothetical protein